MDPQAGSGKNRMSLNTTEHEESMKTLLPAKGERNGGKKCNDHALIGYEATVYMSFH